MDAKKTPHRNLCVRIYTMLSIAISRTESSNNPDSIQHIHSKLETRRPSTNTNHHHTAHHQAPMSQDSSTSRSHQQSQHPHFWAGFSKQFAATHSDRELCLDKAVCKHRTAGQATSTAAIWCSRGWKVTLPSFIAPQQITQSMLKIGHSLTGLQAAGA